MISALDNSMETRNAFKLGAYDYITKPFDHEIILKRLNNALLKRNTAGEINFHNSKPTEKSIRTQVMSQSRSMSSVVKLIEKVSETSCNVIINGESGTGKKRIARIIHKNSSRKKNPFITIHCGAISPPSMETEFFGHEKGSFVGEYEQSIGRIELAHQGSLVLNEISFLSPELQVKLLKFMTEMEFTRVGGYQCLHADVRIIITTKKRLDALVKTGTLNKELYLKLNVISIEVPPLCRRKEDIPILLEHYLIKLNRLWNKKIRGFTPGAIAILKEYPWPGNIQELQNFMERIVLLGTENQVIDKKSINSGFNFILPKGASCNDVEGIHKFSELTPREVEILELVAQGLNNLQISEQLFISPKTVRNHITNIFSKLSIKTRAQAIVLALNNKFFLSK